MLLMDVLAYDWRGEVSDHVLISVKLKLGSKKAVPVSFLFQTFS